MLMNLKGGFLIAIFVIFACSEETKIRVEEATLSASSSILSGKVEHVSDVSSMANQFLSNANIVIINDPEALTKFWSDYGKNYNSTFDLPKIQQPVSSALLTQQGWTLTSLDSRGIFETAKPDTSFVVCLANISTTSKSGYWMVEGCTSQISHSQSHGVLVITYGESGVAYYWESQAN